MYPAVLEFLLWNIQNTQKRKTKQKKNATMGETWHPIKGRDIILLGKRPLMVIMIMRKGSACRHAEPHSKGEEEEEEAGLASG